MNKRKASDISKQTTSNLRVKNLRPLIPPAILQEEIPVPEKVATDVSSARDAVTNILNGSDDRMLVVVGPCSINDPKSAMEYAYELKKIADPLKKDLLVVMRCYPSKPRSTVGWKGLIYDPDLTGAFNINKGLRLTRQLLLDINEKAGLPVGTEFLDTISPQYTSDLIAWGAIGARTTESQVHRELASGLSCPIGFKNGTGGNVQVASDAVRSSKSPHSFLGVTEQGLSAIVSTTGNDCHIILRGGSDGPNYSPEHIKKCQAIMDKDKISSKVVVDCSHGNSKKDHKNQPLVAKSICEQIEAGCKTIGGVMIESNINEGNQPLKIGVTDPATLKYGVSVTDACINLATTKEVLTQLAEAVRARR